MSSYGPSITLDVAKQAAAAALDAARAHSWKMAVAVVDTAGLLVYFEKMDDTQSGSVLIAQSKARSAAMFKRPTKAFQDTLASGGDGLRVLGLEGAVPVEGGVPLLVGRQNRRRDRRVGRNERGGRGVRGGGGERARLADSWSARQGRPEERVKYRVEPPARRLRREPSADHADARGVLFVDVVFLRPIYSHALQACRGRAAEGLRDVSTGT